MFLGIPTPYLDKVIRRCTKKTKDEKILVLAYGQSKRAKGEIQIFDWASRKHDFESINKCHKLRSPGGKGPKKKNCFNFTSNIKDLQFRYVPFISSFRKIHVILSILIKVFLGIPTPYLDKVIRRCTKKKKRQENFSTCLWTKQESKGWNPNFWLSIQKTWFWIYQ